MARLAIASVESAEPDVVLMDVRMPRLDGLAATERLQVEHPGIRIIVLTTFDTDEFVLRAMRLGASGFLLKDTPPRELIDAVRKVAAGDTIVSQSVLGQLIAAVAAQPDAAQRAGASAVLD